MSKHKIIGYFLLVLTLGISFFKDDFSPDYLNTPNAAFLNLNESHSAAIFTLVSHWTFWLKSFLYSVMFVLLPVLSIRFLVNKELAMYTLFILGGLMFVEYILVFSNNRMLIEHVLPKVNRYFHSPILLLFLLAASTLIKKQHGPH